MGKRLNVKQGDGIWIGDDVFVDIKKNSVKLDIEAPAGTRIDHVKAVDRYGRPPLREPKKHGIMPPSAALVLIAALLLGGCSDPAARALSHSDVGGEVVSRPASAAAVMTSGSFSAHGAAVGSGLRERDEWRMIESTPWPASVDPRDREPVEQPALRMEIREVGL